MNQGRGEALLEDTLTTPVVSAGSFISENRWFHEHTLLGMRAESYGLDLGAS